MTHTKDNICIMDVPEGAHSFEMPEQDFGQVLQYKTRTWHSHMLPSDGSWRFVCLSTEMTEEKAREVVGEGQWDHFGDDLFWNYIIEEASLRTALESFASLMTALGCDPAGTYAVCVKNQTA